MLKKALSLNQAYYSSIYAQSKYGFATKMQAGSTQNKKDSAGRRLGLKKFGGEEVYPDEILVRQRGFKWHPGKNTYYGKDHTIHSKAEGIVRFEKDPWRKKKLLYVNVDPVQLPNRTNRPPPPFCYHPELYPELAKANPAPTNFVIKKSNHVEKKAKETWFKVNSDPVYKVEIKSIESYLSPAVEIKNINEQILDKFVEIEGSLPTKTETTA